MTHSPLPWRIENTKASGEVVFDACGDRVHVAGNALAGDNMKLAVRAVNAHNGLMYVLENAVIHGTGHDWRKLANAALKLARGEA